MIAIRVDMRGLDKPIKWLAALPPKITRAKDQALMNGGDKVRTEVRRALKVITGVKRYGTIVERTPSSYAASAGAYTITVKGPGLPITEFPVRLTGKGVQASPWGVSRLFKRSFAVHRGVEIDSTSMSAGKMVSGYMARTTAKRRPIRKLYGPNLAKEATQGVMPVLFMGSVRANVGGQLVARLGKAWG